MIATAAHHKETPAAATVSAQAPSYYFRTSMFDHLARTGTTSRPISPPGHVANAVVIAQERPIQHVFLARRLANPHSFNRGPRFSATEFLQCCEKGCGGRHRT